MRSMLPGKTHLLPLLFLSYLHTALGKNCSVNQEKLQLVNGTNESVPCDSGKDVFSTVSGDGGESPKKPQPFSIIQTPAAEKVLEGSTVHMKCSLLERINTTIWSLGWFKDVRNNTLTNTSRISIHSSKEGYSILILNKTEVADSGIYKCEFTNYDDIHELHSNGTQLTVDGITDLMVNQTPECISESEGTNVTVECRFRTVNDYNSTVVRWYRNGTELDSTGDSPRIELDRERGFTSLTLMNAAVSDSGNYRCQVESRSRNLTGSGNASRVAITTDAQNTSCFGCPEHSMPDNQLKTGLATIGAGAGAGAAILLLLVAGVVIWKHRSKVSSSESETSPAKEIGLHPPLVSQPSDVTYADLHFHKREVRPDAEVVYAEVRGTPKQRAC